MTNGPMDWSKGTPRSMPSWRRGRAISRRRSGTSSVGYPHRKRPMSSSQRSSRSGHAPESGSGWRNLPDERTNSDEAGEPPGAARSSGATDEGSTLRPANGGARHKSAARCQASAFTQRQSRRMGAALRAVNGLSDAVYDSPCGDLLIHEPFFLAWFLGLTGRPKARAGRRGGGRLSGLNSIEKNHAQPL
jgi:hypothetical protein